MSEQPLFSDGSEMWASARECADAIVRDIPNALPTIEGELERCDVCHELAPVEQLRYLPCEGFNLLVILTEDDEVVVCRCHAPRGLLADGEIFFNIPFSPDWAACSSCQADLDAGRLDPIADRAATNQAGLLGDSMSPGFIGQAHVNLLQLIQRHRLPGDWLLYTS